MNRKMVFVPKSIVKKKPDFLLYKIWKYVQITRWKTSSNAYICHISLRIIAHSFPKAPTSPHHWKISFLSFSFSWERTMQNCRLLCRDERTKSLRFLRYSMTLGQAVFSVPLSRLFHLDRLSSVCIQYDKLLHSISKIQL